MTPNEIMQENHFKLCDDASAAGMNYAYGALDALMKIGQINEDHSRLWYLALRTCPGHQGSRSWCAYCGTLPVGES